MQIKFETTTLTYHVTGMGDNLGGYQFLTAFKRFCEEYGDPKLGHIVITHGNSWSVCNNIPKGDINIHWWVGGPGSDMTYQWLDSYVEKANVKPEIILAMSHQTTEYAQKQGFKALWAPAAVGIEYTPMHMHRKGIGYRGTWNHKGKWQEAIMIDPLREKYGLDEAWLGTNAPKDKKAPMWPSETAGPMLSKWHNEKKLVIITTKKNCEEMGILNGRVVEACATETPFIMHKHRSVEDVINCKALGNFPCPYQSSSAEETLSVVEEMFEKYDATLNNMRVYGEHVRRHHTFDARAEQLVTFLQGKDPWAWTN